MRDDSYAQLVAYLTEYGELAPEQLRPDQRIAELALDSLALAELSLVMEEETGFQWGDLGPRATLADAAAQLAAAAHRRTGATT